jgi:hypothetical protein
MSWRDEKLVLPIVIISSIAVISFICFIILYTSLPQCSSNHECSNSIVYGSFQNQGKLPVYNAVFSENLDISKDKVFLTMTNNSLLGAVDVSINKAQTNGNTTYNLSQPFPVTTTTQINLPCFPNLLTNLNIKVVILNNGEGWGILTGGPTIGTSARWCYADKPYPNQLTEIVLVPAAVDYSSDVVIIDGKPVFIFADNFPDGNIYIMNGIDVLGSKWVNSVTITDAKIAKDAYKYLNLVTFQETTAICYQRGKNSPTLNFDIMLITSNDIFNTYKSITVFNNFDSPSLSLNPVTGLVRIVAHGYQKISVSTGYLKNSVFTTVVEIPFTASPVTLYIGNLSADVMGVFVQAGSSVNNYLYLSSDNFKEPQSNIITVTKEQATQNMKVIFLTLKGFQRIYAFNNDASYPLTLFSDKTDNVWTETNVSTTTLWNVGVLQISEDLAMVCVYGALQNTVPVTAPIITQVFGQVLMQDMFYVTS